MIRYRYVDKRHRIPRAVFEGKAAEFWKNILDPVPCAIVASEGGRVIAWTRYELTNRGSVLWAAGTWVEPDYRGLGLTYELWGRLMKRYDPERVNLRTISDGGRILSAALVRWFPEVTFEVAA